MGLLNAPKLARNERQGLMSPLEIKLDTMANDPLRPGLTSSMMQQDLINKGLLAIGMAPLGMTAIKLNQIAPNKFEYISDTGGPVSRWVFKKEPGKYSGFSATQDGRKFGDSFESLDDIKGWLRSHYYGD